jgi:hypothetical protein
MCERERRYFRPAKTAAQKDSENRTIAQSLYRRDVRLAEESLFLRQGKPVSNPDSFRLHALGAEDANRVLRCEQPVVGSLGGQLADS